MNTRPRLKQPLNDHPHAYNPARVYRVGRLASLFDVTSATIWRWERDGVIPKRDCVNGWSQAAVDTMRKRDGVV